MSLNSRKLLRSLLLAGAVATQLRGEIGVLAVTSSAGGARGLPGPGSLATVYCTGLTGISGIVAAPGSPFPTTLAGVRVNYAIYGDAPILAVADLRAYQLVNFQVPWSPNPGPVTLSQGSSSAVLADSAAPWGQFFTDPDGYVVAQHASDYRLVTAENPARAGEWIIAYGSNFGEVVGPPPTGAATPLDRTAPLDPGTPVGWLFRPQMIATGVDVRLETNFIGLAPDLVGVYQINLRMPDTIPSGNVRVIVQRSRDCGFFFLQGCGRGLILGFSSMPLLRH